jgi:hypothetical protein
LNSLRWSCDDVATFEAQCKYPGFATPTGKLKKASYGIQSGVNVFPDLSPTLDADTDIPGANLGLTIHDGMKK